MNCKFCGARLYKNAKFCAHCGAKTEQEEHSTEEKIIQTNEQTVNTDNHTATTKRKFSGKAITGFVLSLCGIAFLELICSVIGLIFSCIALGDIKRKNYKGKGLAIAGLVVGIVATVLSFIYTLVYVTSVFDTTLYFMSV